MNAYFAWAAALVIILCLVHSVLGEILLIRRLNSANLPSLAPFSLIEVRQMGLIGSPDLARDTLRLTWHLPTVLGLGFGAILLWLSLPTSPRTDLIFVAKAMALSSWACTLIVLFCSKGKHPGWLAFLAIAILTSLGSR
jgi:hypothetical protein